MSELVSEAKILLVYRKCDHCNTGTMMRDPNADPVSFGQIAYKHKCNICGHEELYPVNYPYQRLVRTEDLREPTEGER